MYRFSNDKKHWTWSLSVPLETQASRFLTLQGMEITTKGLEILWEKQ